jgi:signal transduction histidine kinase
VLATIALFLIFEGLHFSLQNYVLRAQYFSGLSAGLFFYLAALAWRIGRREQSRNAHWISGVYGLLATAYFFRMFYLIGSSGDVNIMTEGLTGQLIALAALLTAVMGHFGYVGLALDRSMRREIKAAVDRARDEVSHRLGEQIAQLDRQRSLGELSASFGYELNQPLTAILSNAQVAKRRLQANRFETAPLNEFLDKIVLNTRRASQIIERIRGFIRPSVSRIGPINLHTVVYGVAELVADEARSCEVSFIFPPSATQPILVSGDSIQLSQIILNVFRNAIEALAQAQVAWREIQVSYSKADGRAILRIRDTGPGFSPEALAQVGTPFFTTKSSGLGLGVSIARSIAKQMGGTLTLANDDGSGALVELNLPALPEAKA